MAVELLDRCLLRIRYWAREVPLRWEGGLKELILDFSVVVEEDSFNGCGTIYSYSCYSMKDAVS